MNTDDTRVLLAHKLFGAARGLSHVGLGVAAISTAKTLRANGIIATPVAVNSADEIEQQISKTPHSHVIVSAPWIPTEDLAALTQRHPEVKFAVCCHSNSGFLQADRRALTLIRQAMELEASSHNFHLAGNSTRFCDWIQAAFNSPCAFLPNLYYLDQFAGGYTHHHPVGTSGPLRIGIFGATRPLKNLLTASGAAIEVARSLRMPLELWLSGGRAEGGGEVVLGAIRELTAGLPGVELKFNSWQSWPQFRQTVGTLHLLLQPSYTESFNMTVADAVSQGVPAVVSSAITWMPTAAQADSDDAHAIAQTARRILHDPHAAQEGLTALKRYVHDGIAAYRKFLAA
jgi:hypothetical protein